MLPQTSDGAHRRHRGGVVSPGLHAAVLVEGDREQHADDRQHDHQLDQREPALPRRVPVARAPQRGEKEQRRHP